MSTMTKEGNAMTKEQEESKQQLKKLAKDVKFQSVMFADEFGHSTREDLRYYLWMVELHQWLYDSLRYHIPICKSTLETDLIEYLTKLKNQTK